MFDKNILPIGESTMHFPIEDCPCGPKVRRLRNKLYLFHMSFDHREIWLAIEVYLGITCYEHMLFVDRNKYVPGQPHDHVPKPPSYFEYDHKKIDPR